MTIGKMLVTALTVLSLSAPALAAQEIVINGSTTVLPVMQKAGEAFMASHSGEVKALVDYLLDPGKGQKSVREVGYVPLAHYTRRAFAHRRLGGVARLGHVGGDAPGHLPALPANKIPTVFKPPVQWRVL